MQRRVQTMICELGKDQNVNKRACNAFELNCYYIMFQKKL